jgi:hypothetical protein
MSKPKMMRPEPSAPAGLEQDSRGRPIPLEKRTKDDREETLSRKGGKDGFAASALCVCGHRHSQHEKHAPYLCETQGCACDGFTPQDTKNS